MIYATFLTTKDRLESLRIEITVVHVVATFYQGLNHDLMKSRLKTVLNWVSIDYKKSHPLSFFRQILGTSQSG
jgi:hypothetical protein